MFSSGRRDLIQVIDFQVVLLYYVLQLRECLESEVYELFHKKLTEQALIKDPKFLWCCHVSVTSPVCNQFSKADVYIMIIGFNQRITAYPCSPLLLFPLLLFSPLCSSHILLYFLLFLLFPLLPSPQCSYGFIYDGDQLKVTCFQCCNSFCAQCKKPVSIVWLPVVLYVLCLVSH